MWLNWICIVWAFVCVCLFKCVCSFVCVGVFSLTFFPRGSSTSITIELGFNILMIRFLIVPRTIFVHSRHHNNLLYHTHTHSCVCLSETPTLKASVRIGAWEAEQLSGPFKENYNRHAYQCQFRCKFFENVNWNINVNVNFPNE